MAIKDRILKYLSEVKYPVCDDCLVTPVGCKSRQQARNRSINLQSEGKVNRYKGQCGICQRNKTITAATGEYSNPVALESPSRSTEIEGVNGASPTSPDKPWHWEGNVQSVIASWLAKNGYSIRQVANTGTHEAGKDIIALDSEGKELWVTVKGFPEKKAEKSTNPSTQARHWFSHAIFDTVLYRDENPGIKIAVGLPAGFQTYKSLADRIRWYKDTVPFTFFWVSEDGSVKVE